MTKCNNFLADLTTCVERCALPGVAHICCIACMTCVSDLTFNIRSEVGYDQSFDVKRNNLRVRRWNWIGIYDDHYGDADVNTSATSGNDSSHCGHIYVVIHMDITKVSPIQLPFEGLILLERVICIGY
jgi:hypothetical protein